MVTFSITGSSGKTTSVHLVYYFLKHLFKDMRIGMAATSSSKLYENGAEQVLFEDFKKSQLFPKRMHDEVKMDLFVFESTQGVITETLNDMSPVSYGGITNVGDEHSERFEDGIQGVYRIKKRLAEVTHGVFVSNWDDVLTRKMKDVTRADVVFYSKSMDVSSVEQLDAYREGAAFIVCEKDVIYYLFKGDVIALVRDVKDIPVLMGGTAEFNLENLMLALGMVVSYLKDLARFDNQVSLLSSLVHDFEVNFDNLPGRLNIFKKEDVDYIVDFCHSLVAYERFMEFLKKYQLINEKKRVLMLARISSRRRPELVRKVGEVVAGVVDYVVVVDRAKGKKRGYVAREMMIGMKRMGMKDDAMVWIDNTEQAMDVLVAEAQAGDLVAMLPRDLKNGVAYLKKALGI